MTLDRGVRCSTGCVTAALPFCQLVTSSFMKDVQALLCGLNSDFKRLLVVIIAATRVSKGAVFTTVLFRTPFRCGVLLPLPCPILRNFGCV